MSNKPKASAAKASSSTASAPMVVIFNQTDDGSKGSENVYSVDSSSMMVVQMESATGEDDIHVDVTDVGEDHEGQQMIVSANEFFQCAVCRESFISQVDFFVHLKAHYEPKKKAATEPARPKQSTSVIPPKKRGRKSKQEMALATEALKQEKKENEAPTPQVQASPTKTTRSGRISKPRPRDLDMIPLSPIKPKSEPIDPDDLIAAFDDDIADRDVNLDEEVASDDDAEEGGRTTVKRHRKKRRRTQNVRKPRKNSLNVKRVQLDEGGTVKLECDICKKLYANTTSMQVHMRIHNGEKPFQCMDCGRMFRQQSDLKYHQASLHSLKKAYQCEFCGKEFSRKYSLTIHQKIHTGVRDYKCDICNKGFRAAIYMTEHRRIHTGEKPFQCQICGRGFRIKSDMDRHRINVHFKGRKAEAEAMKLEVREDEASVEKDDMEDETATAAQYVTIASKDDENGTGTTMHRLVFISENEAILV